MKKAANTISLIIPTYNRLPYLKNCLRALKKQKFKNFEIIVVNDGSNDGTGNFLDSEKNLKVIQHKKNLGPSISRNDGAGFASADILVFTDDDCEPEENWLLEIVQSFKDSDFIFGRTVYVRANYEGNFPERIVQNPDALWPMANNLAFKKNVFKKLGGFDSYFDKFHNEDSELAIRAVSKNYRFKRLPSALVYHQKTNWKLRGLLCSAKNASVWPILKKKYPHNYKIFNPPIRGIFVNREDYFFILILPILLPALLLRFILNGKNNFLLFFTKWPLVLILRRFYIWKESIVNGIIML